MVTVFPRVLLFEFNYEDPTAGYISIRLFAFLVFCKDGKLFALVDVFIKIESPPPAGLMIDRESLIADFLYIIYFLSFASMAILSACLVNSFSFFTLIYSIGDEKHSFNLAE